MTFTAALCEGCPIQGRYRPVEAIGNESARFLVVTDKPTASAAQSGRLLSPAAVTVFANAAKAQGFVQSDFRFAPSCRCPYDPDRHDNAEKRAFTKHCRQHLLAEIETGQAEVLIPLGADATSQTFGRGTLITRVRGLGHTLPEFSQPVFPLLSPGIVVKYPQNAPLFAADMESFGRFVDAGYDASAASAMDDSSTTYEIVEDLEFLIAARASVISFDTENTGLRWYQRGVDVRTYREKLHKGSPVFQPRFQILTMQFSIEPGKAYMLVWDHPEAPIAERNKPRLRNQLRRLLCNPDTLVVGQNVKYDKVALWKTEGIRFRIGGDTQMLATLLDENQRERNLDVLTKLHVPEMAGYADRFNTTVDKSRMWEVPLGTMRPYGCGDADAALRVYNVLEPAVMQDDKLWNHYCRISIPGLNAFAGLDSRGMLIDADEALPEFQEVMAREVEEQRVALLAQIPRAVKRDVVAKYQVKHRGPSAAEEALSFSRADFLRDVLFNHPQGFKLVPKAFTKTTTRLVDENKRIPSVSAKDHLPYFFEECPFTLALAEYIKDSTLLERSVINFRNKYVVDNYVRPVYGLAKTATGRSNSEDPNGQNFPKRGARAKAYRKMFTAPPGYYLISCDLSQAELRIAAAMANDREMISIYASGGDIHRATACIVKGVTMAQFETLPKAEQKDARQKAKAVNFGFLYGMGWRKFIVYAKTQYNAEFTEEEARRVRVAYFRKYRSLEPWHVRMREFAHEHKFVRSFSGRIRHLPMIDSPEDGVRMEAERQAINSPVQEFGSSLGVMSLGEINETIDPQYLQMVGFVHDALVGYVKKEYLDWGLKTVKRTMETLPLQEWFGLRLPLPIVADASFGENLGEEFELADFGGFTLEEPFDFTLLKDKDGVPLITVPRQRTPPNEGRLLRSAYTTPDDLEDENTEVESPNNSRKVYGVLSTVAQKRIAIGKKQVVINRRHIQQRREQDKEVRARLVKRVKRT